MALTILVLAVATAHAQAPPLPQTPPAAPSRAAPPPLPAPGFVSAYEIMRTLRSAGFDPLAPPLREGTIYVARATDYRGILMRVVLDARTGAIRDANRIVPGPGNYAGAPGGIYGARAYGGPDGSGPYEAEPEPYDAEPDAPGPEGFGPDDGAGMVRLPYGLPPDANAAPAPPAAHPSAGGSVMPLPRPRPPELASRKSRLQARRKAGRNGGRTGRDARTGYCACAGQAEQSAIDAFHRQLTAFRRASCAARRRAMARGAIELAPAPA